MKKNCQKCGQEIKGNQKFCTNCGTAITVEWYYASGNTPSGPYSDEQIRSMYKNEIQPGTLVWNESLPEWIKIEDSGLVLEEHQTKDEDYQWYIANGENPDGPYTAKQIEEKVHKDELANETLIWNESLPEWVKLENTDFIKNKPIENQTIVKEPVEAEEQWYYTKGNSPQGPYTRQQIQELYNNEIEPGTLVWNEGLSNWIAIEESGLVSQGIIEDKHTPNSEAGTEEQSDAWYYARGNQQYGPVNSEKIYEEIQCGNLRNKDLIWKKGWPQWMEIESTEWAEFLLKKPMLKPAIEKPQLKPASKLWIVAIAGALVLSVAAGAFLAKQHKISEELKQAETLQKQKEEEAKKAEEEKQKAEQEAKEKEKAAQQKEEEEKKKLNGTYRSVVANDIVNIRKGPGKHYADVGDLGYGNKVVIVETEEQGEFLWGKMEDGNWVCIKRGSEVYLEKD